MFWVFPTLDGLITEDDMSNVTKQDRVNVAVEMVMSYLYDLDSKDDENAEKLHNLIDDIKLALDNYNEQDEAEE